MQRLHLVPPIRLHSAARRNMAARPCRSLFFNKEMELSLIGLQNAGKTSLVNVLATGNTTDTIPTVGFNMRKVTKGGVTMRVWDLGGQARQAKPCMLQPP